MRIAAAAESVQSRERQELRRRGPELDSVLLRFSRAAVLQPSRRAERRCYPWLTDRRSSSGVRYRGPQSNRSWSTRVGLQSVPRERDSRPRCRRPERMPPARISGEPNQFGPRDVAVLASLRLHRLRSRCDLILRSVLPSSPPPVRVFLTFYSGSFSCGSSTLAASPPCLFRRVYSPTSRTRTRRRCRT